MRLKCKVTAYFMNLLCNCHSQPVALAATAVVAVVAVVAAVTAAAIQQAGR